MDFVLLTLMYTSVDMMAETVAYLMLIIMIDVVWVQIVHAIGQEEDTELSKKILVADQCQGTSIWEMVIGKYCVQLVSKLRITKIDG